MSEAVDILVVGAGPAGAIAACGLARRGRSVWLVDKAKFPRDKVCGGCLNPSALATLHQLGIDPGGAPVRTLRLWKGAHRADVALPTGRAILRRTLDVRLAKAATDAGARFEDGAPASVIRFAHGDQPHVVRVGEREVRVNVLVAADGLTGTLLGGRGEWSPQVEPGGRMGLGAVLPESLGLEPGLEPGVIHMHTHAAGYVGAVVLEDGRLNVAAALDPGWVKSQGGPGEAATRVLGRDLPEADWHGTGRLTRRRAKVAGHRLLVVGDAAGYVEPFTGEGMAWAITAGAALAGVLGSDQAWDPATSVRWDAAYRRLVRRRQLGCRAVAAALRHPGLVGAAVGVLGRAPGLARPLIHHMSRPAKPLTPSPPQVSPEPAS